MKTLFLYLFFFAACGMYAQNNRHIGSWEGADKGQKINLNFQKDGSFILELGGVTYGGEGFEIEGQKMSVSYTIDYSSEVPGFYVLLKNADTGEIVSKMIGTITFNDNSSATICMKRAKKEETEPEFAENECLPFTKTK